MFFAIAREAGLGQCGNNAGGAGNGGGNAPAAGAPAAGAPGASGAPVPVNSAGAAISLVSSFDAATNSSPTSPGDPNSNLQLRALLTSAPNAAQPPTARFSVSFTQPGGNGGQWKIVDDSAPTSLQKSGGCTALPPGTGDPGDTVVTRQDTYTTITTAGGTFGVNSFVSDFANGAKSLKTAFLQAPSLQDPTFACGLDNLVNPPSNAPLGQNSLSSVFGVVKLLSSVAPAKLQGPALPFGKQFLVFAQVSEFPVNSKPPFTGVTPVRVNTYLVGNINGLGSPNAPAGAPGTTPITGNSSVVSATITGYGYPDNAPPSSEISHPIVASHNGIAGGIGTFDNPITFATEPANNGKFPFGTKIYVPFLQRYFIREDDCTDSGPSFGSGNATCNGIHFDLWVGGEGLKQGNPQADAVIQCEEAITRSNSPVTVNPPANLPVKQGPIFSNGQCNP